MLTRDQLANDAVALEAPEIDLDGLDETDVAVGFDGDVAVEAGDGPALLGEAGSGQPDEKPETEGGDGRTECPGPAW
jgi:hypothetical protein